MRKLYCDQCGEEIPAGGDETAFTVSVKSAGLMNVTVRDLEFCEHHAAWFKNAVAGIGVGLPASSGY